MRVVRSSGRVIIAFLGLLLSLTPVTHLLLVLVPVQSRELVEYGSATVVALPVSLLFVQREYSLKRLWTFVYRAFVLELFFGLLVVGLLLVGVGVLHVASVPVPSFDWIPARLSRFLFGSLLVAPAYWISYRATYAQQGD